MTRVEIRRARELRSGARRSLTLRAANGEIVGVSQRYPTRAGRDAGVEAVKRNAEEPHVEE